MGILKFLTGHDPKESDVFKDDTKVKSVISEINAISSHEIATAKSAIHDALNELNNVNGLKELVGFNVNLGAFDDVFDNVGKAVEEIATEMERKSEDIEAYANASGLEKLGSTILMAGAKVGEGFLSVIEDIGDGAVSLVGFVGGTFNKDFKNACGEFVKKDWSHDAFDFYYNSSLAKKSLFTEDSFIAGALKTGGSVAGYMTIGGFVGGKIGSVGEKTLGKALTKVASGNGKITSKVASTILKGSTSTYANAAVANLAGIGSGTEAGLIGGKSFDESFQQGAVQGAIQGGVALGAGIISDKIKGSKQKSLDEATKKYNEVYEKADDTFVKRVQADAKFDAADDELLARSSEYNTATKDYNKAYQKAEDALQKQVQAKAKLDIAKSELDSLDDEMMNLIKNGGSQAEIDALKAKGIQAVNKYTNAQNAYKLAEDTFNQLDDALLAKANDFNTATKAYNDAFKKADEAFLNKELAKTAFDAADDELLAAAVNMDKTTKALDKATQIGSKIVTAGTVANAAGRTISHAAGSAAGQFQNSDYLTKKDITPQNPIDNRGVGNLTPDEPVGNNGKKGGTTPPTDDDDEYDDTRRSENENDVSSSDEQFKKDELKNKVTKEPDKSEKPAPSPDPSPSPSPSPSPEPTPDPTPYPDPSPMPSPSPVPNPDPQPPTPGSNQQSGQSSTTHYGGEYSASDGYVSDNNQEDGIKEETQDGLLSDSDRSLDDIVRGKKYSKIPSSSKPITTTGKKTSGSGIIPIAAGLSAAAAAGVGAKAYMDHKKNNDFDEDEELETEEWDEDTGTDTMEIDYDDSSTQEEYLDDDYDYQPMENEKYGARNNEELADLQ